MFPQYKSLSTSEDAYSHIDTSERGEIVSGLLDGDLELSISYHKSVYR